MLHLALVLLLVLTGQSYAAARGQVMQGQEIILCSGTVLTVTDQGGDPHVHLCPDMVLSLMAGQSWEPDLPEADAVPRLFVPSRPVLHSLSHPVLRRFARGPPLG
ncbi:hypothetical protein [Paracoccus jiaweipingae]|uniref:hypothetical protein n=1 Tax=unclassified Paracoccus (in: a-proteobacteria) TaxID=2688777 RepID=UPI0037AD6C23